MTLILLGINHKTAPIELRERVAISRDSLAGAAMSLVEVEGVSEALILSTCNRVEILTAVETDGADIAGFLHRHFAIEPGQLLPHLYVYRDRDAVRHLFRVAASLDSMVVGESQILGQLRSCAGELRFNFDPQVFGGGHFFRDGFDRGGLRKLVAGPFRAGAARRCFVADPARPLQDVLIGLLV